MHDSERFWDRIAPKYAQMPIADMEAYQRKLELTRAFFRPDMTVLELGCGTGLTAVAHAPHVAHVHGVDVSPEMIAICRRNADAASVSNISFEHRTVDRLSDADRGYDAILALSFLHLATDMEGLVADAFKYLPAGGLFVTNSACIGDLNIVVRGLLPIGQMLGRVPPLNVFGFDHLRSAIKHAGFELAHVWRLPRGAFIIARKPVGAH